jgi:NDP-sugar pyrophosphorylase family protein
MLGDTLNDFNLTKMIIFHLHNDKIATVGLISTERPGQYSRIELEGDRIVEFRSKSASHIIDAGIYICKPVVFQHCNGKKYLDRDVFPKLCHTNDIKGYFTYGKYKHLG